MPYLFVHFREKATPDGEQVYFGLSRDAFHWEAVNNGRPVLWALYGDKGVRDHTITRDAANGKFYILATDLSLCYGMRSQYHGSWEEISVKGSHDLALWESGDLVHWTEQRMVRVGTERLGCCWAPDVLTLDDGSFLLHWSSPVADDGYAKKRIFCRRTRDFVTFSDAEQLYEKEEDIIDSAMYEEDGVFYLFVKSGSNPSGMILLRSDAPTGPFTRVEAFDEAMKEYHNGLFTRRRPPCARRMAAGACLSIITACAARARATFPLSRTVCARRTSAAPTRSSRSRTASSTARSSKLPMKSTSVSAALISPKPSRAAPADGAA